MHWPSFHEMITPMQHLCFANIMASTIPRCCNYSTASIWPLFLSLSLSLTHTHTTFPFSLSKDLFIRIWPLLDTPTSSWSLCKTPWKWFSDFPSYSYCYYCSMVWMNNVWMRDHYCYGRKQLKICPCYNVLRRFYPFPWVPLCSPLI